MSPSLPQSWKEGSACLKFDHSHACPEKDLPEHPLQINSVPPRVTCTLLPDVLASSLLPQFGVLHHQETTVNFCNNDLYSCPHPVLILPSQTPLRPHEVRGDSFGRTFSPYSVHLDFLLFSGFMPVELRWLMPTVCVLALVPHCSISKIISTQIICILHWCHVLSKSCYFPSHYCSCDSSPLREILCWNFNQSFGRIGEVQYTLIFRHGLDLKPCEPCPQIYLLYVVPHIQGKAELESTCLAVGWPCSPLSLESYLGCPLSWAQRPASVTSTKCFLQLKKNVYKEVGGTRLDHTDGPGHAFIVSSLNYLSMIPLFISPQKFPVMRNQTFQTSWIL